MLRFFEAHVASQWGDAHVASQWGVVRGTQIFIEIYEFSIGCKEVRKNIMAQRPQSQYWDIPCLSEQSLLHFDFLNYTSRSTFEMLKMLKCCVFLKPT
jgi:hypothetical protein